MSDIFASPFFGITISILAFFIGLEIQKRTKIALWAAPWDAWLPWAASLSCAIYSGWMRP